VGIAEEEEASRGCRRFKAFEDKRENDEAVKSEMGLRVLRRGFGKRERQLKVAVDEATCRTMGGAVGGASDQVASTTA